MPKILVLHGPNLNLLGVREPELYGAETLEDINTRLQTEVEAAGHQFEALQSNAEHILVDKIQASRGNTAYMVINPGAFTHTSVALRDAILAVEIPFVEVHLSNVHAREPFRQHSYFSDIAAGTIVGLGSLGYSLAVTAILQRLSKSTQE